MDPQILLRQMFDVAVASADPRYCVPRNLPAPPKGRTIVVGAGKAAAAMAQALESAWPEPPRGAVVTRYGHGAACRHIQVIEAAHPNPDVKGVEAGRVMLSLVQGLTADDLVICLLSGGGSALLAAPPPGVTLEEKQALTRALLRSGAAIDEINTVRKHLSLIKGGRLAAAAWPAPVVTLAISDVPGDDPGVIASGPTVQDTTLSAEAFAILDRHAIETPPAVAAWLGDPRSESPRLCDGGDYRLIATPGQALRAAAACAARRGVAPVVLGDDLEGEARGLGADHGRLARNLAGRMGPDDPPQVILSGGETTVTVRGGGRGGRNSEYLLGLAIELQGAPGVYAIAADTDGIDGIEDNAGAIIGPDILTRAALRGRDPSRALADNDAYGFFEAAEALLFTGPTRTNVNDFRGIWVGRRPGDR